jgi:hypothetical protein
LLIEPLLPERAAALEAFNSRLRAGGSPLCFDFPEALGRQPRGLLTTECFAAVDDGGQIRGVYRLIHQPFWVADGQRTLPFLQLPLSEGIVDRGYAAVGLMLITDALRRAPLMFALGMGSIERPLPRMLRLLGAQVREVPFYFRLLRRFSVFRSLPMLRATRARRWAADFAAYSGAGSLALAGLDAVRRRSGVRRRELRWEFCEHFPEWADVLWESSKAAYSMIAVRDRAHLECLYQPASTLRRMVVFRESQPIGWALLIDCPVRDHRFFGTMRVGVVADALAAPGQEDAVVAAADFALADMGVDVSVSNQMAPAWRHALERAGYLRHKSNYILALAKPLATLLTLQDPEFQRIHLNRGDGDRAYSV